MGFEEITIAHANVSATVAPARGALVTGLKVNGKDALYLDRASFDDASKNVRGGIPVLFPYAGKLIDEVFVHANTKMKQHGFGRNKSWAVVEKKPDAVTVQLKPDAETRAQYPYDFLAEQTCTVLPRGLQVDLLIANHGDQPMPVSPGWHPYYCCHGPSKGQVTGDVAGLSADKLGNDKEFDFGLPAPMLGRGHFNVPGLGKLTVKFTPVMRHMQFWSQPGKDFICIEPFFGPNNTVNTEKRYDIPPKQCRVFWMRIEID